MRVLLVENADGKQSALCECLRRQDYRVELASCGREAIALASRRSFDLIVLDLNLPTESSLLVLHEIRELDRDCKILILSAPEQIRDRVTALIQGADDYLVKPISPQSLAARIESLATGRDQSADSNEGAGGKAARLSRQRRPC